MPKGQAGQKRAGALLQKQQAEMQFPLYCPICNKGCGSASGLAIHQASDNHLTKQQRPGDAQPTNVAGSDVDAWEHANGPPLPDADAADAAPAAAQQPQLPPQPQQQPPPPQPHQQPQRQQLPIRRDTPPAAVRLPVGLLRHIRRPSGPPDSVPPDVEISGLAAWLAARLSYTQKRLSPLLAAMSTSAGNTLLQLLRDPRFKPADAWTSMVAFLADINKDHVSDCCNHPL